MGLCSSPAPSSQNQLRSSPRTWRRVSFFSSACCLFLWRKPNSVLSVRRTPSPSCRVSARRSGALLGEAESAEQQMFHWKRAFASPSGEFPGAGRAAWAFFWSAAFWCRPCVSIPLQPQRNLPQEVSQLLSISIRANYTKQIVSRHVSVIFNWWP